MLQSTSLLQPIRQASANGEGWKNAWCTVGMIVENNNYKKECHNFLTTPLIRTGEYRPIGSSERQKVRLGISRKGICPHLYVVSRRGWPHGAAGDTNSEKGGPARLPAHCPGCWPSPMGTHKLKCSVRRGKKLFVLGWPEQPRQDIAELLVPARRANEPTKEGLLSFTLFISVSTVCRSHPPL